MKEFTLSDSKTITIASNNFTEQNMLAEIMAQLIEQSTDLKVIRRFNLGANTVLHEAIINGKIDIYPEYTGTAYLNILNQPMRGKDYDIFAMVKTEYKKQYNLDWLKPFGFSNSNSLAIKKSFAKIHNIKTMTDLAHISASLKIAAPADFLKRIDGLPGLTKAYGYKFKKIIQVDSVLMYVALNSNNVDVIAAFTTDGKLNKFDIVTLLDDKGMYPPYAAAPVIRSSILKKYPEILKALEPVFGSINENKMMHLNYLVEVAGISYKQVARQFIAELNIKKN